MKKINLLLALSTLVAAFTLSSCKHGENDPFISLRSRDARIKGAWNLSTVTGTYTIKETVYDIFGNQSTSGTGTRTITLTDAGALNVTQTVSGTVSNWIPVNQDWPVYKLALDIQANGKCSSTETVQPKGSNNTRTATMDGTWNWGNDSKNKNSLYCENLLGSQIINKVDAPVVYYTISGLKNKEMEITITSTSKDSNTDKKGQKETEENYNFVLTFKQ